MNPLKMYLALVLSIALVACGGPTSQPSLQPPQADITVILPESLEIEKGSDSTFFVPIYSAGVNIDQPDEVDVVFPGTNALKAVRIVPYSNAHYITLRADEQAPTGILEGKIVVKSGAVTKVVPFSITIKSKATGSYYSSFGENGGALLNLPATANKNVMYSARVDAQGRIWALGYSELNRGTDGAFTVTRFLSSGALDKSFGGDGSVLINPSDDKEQGHEIYVTPKGEVLVLGYYKGSFGVMRLLKDGTIDSSYGTQGTLLLDSYSWGFSSFQSSDGKIIIASSNAGDKHYSISRLNADGTLDNTFASIYFTVWSYPFQNYSNIVSLSNGDLIIAFNEYDTDGNILLKKFKSNGEVDQSFGSDGQISIDLGSNEDRFNTLTIDSQDRLLLHGKTKNLDMILIKLTKDGDRVMSFGENGQITLTGVQDRVLNFAISKGDDTILYESFPTTDSAALRVTAEGDLNRFSFGRPLPFGEVGTSLNRFIWSNKLNRYIGLADFRGTDTNQPTSRGVLYTFSP